MQNIRGQPSSNMRSLNRIMHTSKNSVLRVENDKLPHPYKLTKVHARLAWVLPTGICKSIRLSMNFLNYYHLPISARLLREAYLIQVIVIYGRMNIRMPLSPTHTTINSFLIFGLQLWIIRIITLCAWPSETEPYRSF